MKVTFISKRFIAKLWFKDGILEHIDANEYEVDFVLERLSSWLREEEDVELVIEE